MRVAIVGGGISGMVSGYLLSRQHDVTVFEANDYIGGHTHTVDVPDNGSSRAVDTGFVVFNRKNYPNFSQLLGELGVKTRPTCMSFSVRCDLSGMEYNGSSINTLFAQRRNLFRPRFLSMIRGLLRFYREAPELLRQDFAGTLTLGDFLDRGGYSRDFIDDHLIPMGSAIWSSDPDKMKDFPARAFVQFFSNHGFLRLRDRPQWRIIEGGSRRYVERLTAPYRDRVRLRTPIASVTRGLDSVTVQPARGQAEVFEAVVLATHSDQTLKMLADPSDREREILTGIKYQPNDVALHTDSALLPRRPLVRASWNYHLTGRSHQAPTVTYYMNHLQKINSSTDFCVTLNRSSDIDRNRVIRRLTYHHPIYSFEALRAQRRHGEINGQNRTFYCGAYWGYGFHEDGVNSALEVCRHFGESL